MLKLHRSDKFLLRSVEPVSKLTQDSKYLKCDTKFTNYLLGCPNALVVRVINHGRFPLAVHLIIPVFRLGGIGVWNVLRFVPVFGFLVLGVGDGSPLVPVLGLLGFGILCKREWLGNSKSYRNESILIEGLIGTYICKYAN